MKRSVYVAGFDRGVRPIGDWSMSITLSNTSIPSTDSCSPGFVRILCSWLAAALKTISLTSVDLPEPDTPVTAMNLPTGNSTSMSFRLCCEAPRTVNEPRSSVRRGGTAISRAPDRNCPVTDARFFSTFAAVPSATTWPPCSPAPGPMSTSQSAARIICSSCSTTTTVLPSVLEPLERADQLPVVALVEADRRLVEDVEHADELRADLRREPQPLRLAARQRRRPAVEVQVTDPDVVEERQPLADLLDDPRADHLLDLGQLELVEELRARA